MTGCRQQKPRFGLTKCPDLVDHYNMVAQKILEAIQQPIELDSTTAAISASIGIAIHQAEDIINADQLISQADSAMYEAKNTGKARVCVHK
ncbi:diguanylate cyclase domain-containing protein [Aeromonas media]|uniref:diguanylate cyclase domain-containing protein n=1 Tax=Aeromonas TaxID=642 RepID=UPI00384E3E81